MFALRRLCSSLGLVLVLCSCRGGGSSTHQTAGSADDAGGRPAASWPLGDVKDPYVVWLAGRGGDAEWPPEPIPGLLRAVGLPADARVEPPWPNLHWDRDGLSVTWDANVPLPGRTCAEVGPAVDEYLEGSGFGPPPAGARRDVRLFYAASGGVERLVSHKCIDPMEKGPGCTGGNCTLPTALEVHYAIGVRATGLTSLDDALAPFPSVGKPLQASLMPPFLAEVVRSARFHSVYCERFTGDTCEWDLRFEVVPPGDAKKWIQEAIDLAKRFGFTCDQSWRDPEKEEIASTQECSGKNLWYHVQQGRVRLRLATIIGATPRGNPVECSADYFAEKGAAPPTPQDPALQEILDVPVRRSAVAHMERVRACYVAHQKRIGRSVEMSDWRRLGEFLQRTGHDTASGQEMTIGVQHQPYARPTANGFFLRVKREVRPDLAVELYIRQEDFEKPYGGGHIELKEAYSVPLFRVTLPWKLTTAVATSEQAFVDAALAAVEETHQGALRGIGRKQDCRVLPNMGQECEWVDTTADEQAEMRKRLEADRDQLRERIRTGRSEIYRAVAELYPWSDPDCSPLVSP